MGPCDGCEHGQGTWQHYPTEQDFDCVCQSCDPGYKHVDWSATAFRLVLRATDVSMVRAHGSITPPSMISTAYVNRAIQATSMSTWSAIQSRASLGILCEGDDG